MAYIGRGGKFSAPTTLADSATTPWYNGAENFLPLRSPPPAARQRNVLLQMRFFFKTFVPKNQPQSLTYVDLPFV